MDQMIGNMIRLFLTAILLPALIQAQPYIDGGATRHRFAQLNIGGDVRSFLSTGSETSFINSSGLLERAELKTQFDTRVIIGGTHFWGHADFYLAIPVIGFGEMKFRTGVETGAKYFPWRIEHKKIRPYLGVSILPIIYQQGAGSRIIRFRYPLMTGLVYNNKSQMVELGLGYNFRNQIDYFISVDRVSKIRTQPFWISLGLKFMLETTLNAENDWISGQTKRLTDSLSKTDCLNGLTIGLGPSSAFFLKSSLHNLSQAPYIGNHKSVNLFPEFGVGYYLHNPDLQLNISYRRMKSEIAAYGFFQHAKRNALTAETFKFINDYHGFAFFIGPALSYEWLTVVEFNHQQLAGDEKYHGLKPGIVFGWDIRPNRLQSWYLRTNLRYFPRMNVQMQDGKNVPFDQLEFNFIQLVVLPGRLM